MEDNKFDHTPDLFRNLKNIRNVVWDSCDTLTTDPLWNTVVSRVSPTEIKDIYVIIEDVCRQWSTVTST